SMSLRFTAGLSLLAGSAIRFSYPRLTIASLYPPFRRPVAIARACWMGRDIYLAVPLLLCDGSNWRYLARLERRVDSKLLATWSGICCYACALYCSTVLGGFLGRRSMQTVVGPQLTNVVVMLGKTMNQLMNHCTRL